MLRNFLMTLLMVTRLLCPNSVLMAQSATTIYLHTDKGAYFPGDTIWFKGYVLSQGVLNKSVHNLYIDWGNREGAIMEHNVYICADGIVPCQFVIPRDYSDHELNLNAYTSSLSEHRELAYFRSIPILQKKPKQQVGTVAVEDPNLRKYKLKRNSTLLVEPNVEFTTVSKEPKGRNSFQVLLPSGEEGNLSISITAIEVPIDSISTILDVGQLDSDLPDSISMEKDEILFLRGRITLKKKTTGEMKAIWTKIKDKKAKTGKALRGVSLGYRKPLGATTLYKEIFPDENGEFEIKNLSFFDSLEVRFVPMESKLKFIPFNVNYSFAKVPKPKSLFFPAWERDTWSTNLSKILLYPENAQYKISRGSITLKEVNIARKRDARLRAMDNHYTRGWYKRPAILEFDVQRDTNLNYVNTVGDYMRYLIKNYPEINKIKPYITIFDEVYPAFHSTVRDISQIAYVKIFESFPLNPDGGGAIAFYTNGPDGSNKSMGQVVNTQTVGGYIDVKSFWHRDYSTQEKKLLSEYDDRQTLYWNPLLLANGTPNKIEFYNNNKAGGYWITIQGVTGSGKLVFYQKLVR